MGNILNYEQFNEGFKEILLGITAFLSVGLSKLEAQEIKKSQDKLSVVSALYDVNNHKDTLDNALNKRGLDYSKLKPYIKQESEFKYVLDNSFVYNSGTGFYGYGVNLNKNVKLQGDFIKLGDKMFPSNVGVTYKITF